MQASSIKNGGRDQLVSLARRQLRSGEPAARHTRPVQHTSTSSMASRARAWWRLQTLGGSLIAAGAASSITLSGADAGSASTSKTGSSTGHSSSGAHRLPKLPKEVLLSTASTSLPLDESKAELKLVQVVFRHGARAPLTRHDDLWKRTGAQWDVCDCAYKAVPLQVTTADGQPHPFNRHNHKQVSKVLSPGVEGVCHKGQLTRYGQLQARDLGQWLRERYVQRLGFLPQGEQEASSLLRARTTNFERTVGTLAGVVTGLLGPGAQGPVPAVTSTDMDEILYADSKQCPHLQVFMTMSKQTAKDLVRQDPEYAWARVELRRLLDLEDAWFNGEWAFSEIHDVVAALTAAGKPIYEGFTPKLVQVVNRLATKEFAPYVAPSIRDSHGHSVLKLSMGVLLHTLVTNMEEAVAAAATTSATSAPTTQRSQGSTAASHGSGNASSSSAAQPKLFLYSGHDSTIMPLLSALGCDTLDSWPPFLSNLVFELWQVPGGQAGQAPQFVVRVLYNREELDIPHCPHGSYATLPAFKHEVIGPFLMSQSQVSEACKVPVDHDSVPHMHLSMSSKPDEDAQSSQQQHKGKAKAK